MKIGDKVKTRSRIPLLSGTIPQGATLVVSGVSRNGRMVNLNRQSGRPAVSSLAVERVDLMAGVEPATYSEPAKDPEQPAVTSEKPKRKAPAKKQKPEAGRLL